MNRTGLSLFSRSGLSRSIPERGQPDSLSKRQALAGCPVRSLNNLDEPYGVALSGRFAENPPYWNQKSHEIFVLRLSMFTCLRIYFAYTATCSSPAISPKGS